MIYYDLHIQIENIRRLLQRKVYGALYEHLYCFPSTQRMRWNHNLSAVNAGICIIHVDEKGIRITVVKYAERLTCPQIVHLTLKYQAQIFHILSTYRPQNSLSNQIEKSVRKRYTIKFVLLIWRC